MTVESSSLLRKLTCLWGIHQGSPLSTKSSVSSTNSPSQLLIPTSISSHTTIGQGVAAHCLRKSIILETASRRLILGWWEPTTDLQTILVLLASSSIFTCTVRGENSNVLIDALLIAFLTPANAMLSVELTHLADLLESVGQGRNISRQAREWSSRIHDAIWDTTVSTSVTFYD